MFEEVPAIQSILISTKYLTQGTGQDSGSLGGRLAKLEHEPGRKGCKDSSVGSDSVSGPKGRRFDSLKMKLFRQVQVRGLGFDSGKMNFFSGVKDEESEAGLAPFPFPSLCGPSWRAGLPFAGLFGGLGSYLCGPFWRTGLPFAGLPGGLGFPLRCFWWEQGKSVSFTEEKKKKKTYLFPEKKKKENAPVCADKFCQNLLLH